MSSKDMDHIIRHGVPHLAKDVMKHGAPAFQQAIQSGAGVGTALVAGTTAGVVGTGAAAVGAVVTVATVGAAVAAVAGVGYGAYKLYKWITD
ncbi:MAG: hypothetical protein JNJ73_04370 [Hyphomonadaceae bacterium]|nr:hypothetical protein [Hyphomonadaceae bacterium]